MNVELQPKNENYEILSKNKYVNNIKDKLEIYRRDPEYSKILKKNDQLVSDIYIYFKFEGRKNIDEDIVGKAFETYYELKQTNKYDLTDSAITIGLIQVSMKRDIIDEKRSAYFRKRVELNEITEDTKLVDKNNPEKDLIMREELVEALTKVAEQIILSDENLFEEVNLKNDEQVKNSLLYKNNKIFRDIIDDIEDIKNNTYSQDVLKQFAEKYIDKIRVRENGEVRYINNDEEENNYYKEKFKEEIKKLLEDESKNKVIKDCILNLYLERVNNIVFSNVSLFEDNENNYSVKTDNLLKIKESNLYTSNKDFKKIIDTIDNLNNKERIEYEDIEKAFKNIGSAMILIKNLQEGVLNNVGKSRGKVL